MRKRKSILKIKYFRSDQKNIHSSERMTQAVKSKKSLQANNLFKKWH